MREKFLGTHQHYYHATFAATAPRPQPPQSSNFRKKWREYTARILSSKKNTTSGQIERKEGNSVETSKMRQMGGKTPYSRRKRALNCGPRKIGPKIRGPPWSKVAKQKWGRDIYAKFRRQKADYLPVANPVWNTHTHTHTYIHTCTHEKEKKMTKSWLYPLSTFTRPLRPFRNLRRGRRLNRFFPETPHGRYSPAKLPKRRLFATGIRHDLRTSQTPGPKNNVGFGDHLVLNLWRLGQKINIVFGARGRP